MHNSDQYLLTVYAPAGSPAGVDMLALLNAIGAAAGVTVETY
jgi:hypothetical protein